MANLPPGELWLDDRGGPDVTQVFHPRAGLGQQMCEIHGDYSLSSGKAPVALVEHSSTALMKAFWGEPQLYQL